VLPTRYYDRWIAAEDSASTVRTQQQSVLGARFFTNGHLVPMKAEYSDEQLHEQIKYYQTLFDVPRAEKRLKETNEKRAKAANGAAPPLSATLSDEHRAVFEHLHASATKTVEQSAYNWVRPSLWNCIFAGGKK
jgi:hypothetical protein